MLSRSSVSATAMFPGQMLQIFVLRTIENTVLVLYAYLEDP